MKVASSLLLCVFLAAGIKAWMEGDGGLVRWDNNCYWTGDDISTSQAPGEQCGGVCTSTPGCTRFNWNGGTCFVKGCEGELVTGQGTIGHIKM